MNRLKWFWSRVRSSVWFIPSLIIGFGSALAVALTETDFIVNGQWLGRWPRLLGVGAEGARGILSTIAGSMMTVAGVTFSMTLMTLMLASTQYTSRILRNFMRDRVTQTVLGIFTGIFAYCLIALRTIRSGYEGGFVPNVAVFFGVVLAMGGIGVFIFFIHHIASAIQASSIISSVADETMAAVDRLFPERLGQEAAGCSEDQLLPTLPTRHWQAVPVNRNGYIQSVNNAALLRLARENKTIVRMERGIGDFVVQGTTLASLALDKPPEKEIITALQDAYSIDCHRTMDQDIAFGIRQIVDMAMRALSPSVNDTTTAVMCVDYLSAILSRLTARNIPSSYRYEEGELRVIAIGSTFDGLVAESFDQIRGSAAGNAAIMLRMIGALQTIASLTVSPAPRRALSEQVQWIAELAERTIESPHDRARLDSRIMRAREAFKKESRSNDNADI